MEEIEAEVEAEGVWDRQLAEANNYVSMFERNHKTNLKNKHLNKNNVQPHSGLALFLNISKPRVAPVALVVKPFQGLLYKSVFEIRTTYHEVVKFA